MVLVEYTVWCDGRPNICPYDGILLTENVSEHYDSTQNDIMVQEAVM